MWGKEIGKKRQRFLQLHFYIINKNMHIDKHGAKELESFRKYEVIVSGFT